jgi:hypothetical protein
MVLVVQPDAHDLVRVRYRRQELDVVGRQVGVGTGELLEVGQTIRGEQVADARALPVESVPDVHDVLGAEEPGARSAL